MLEKEKFHRVARNTVEETTNYTERGEKNEGSTRRTCETV